MIDYKKINKEISQQKWDRIQNKTVDEFTCYYCPGVGHELCTHPQHCILDKEFQRLRGKIQSEKAEEKQLKEIYEDALELKRENPEREYDDFYLNFTPKANRIKRSVLRRSIRKHYAELKDLKTNKGGY
ncbi:hypothetical protein [uncultured Methanobrevibacter sp.]|uniref:hypothetical protein n=1 Tax=uncultured Methanobrevibacter sp. TaxID=253161 RepID=UPI0025F3594D|nr:hypothetical protein [uncultured Methanobrevibacter sp.]